MKIVKVLILSGLMSLPTFGAAASISVGSSSQVSILPQAPVQLTDDQMDKVQGKFLPAAVGGAELAMAGLAGAAYLASRAGNKDLAASASRAADNIQNGIDRMASSVSEWVGNTFDSANRNKVQEKSTNRARNKEAEYETRGMNPKEAREFHDLKDGGDGGNRTKEQLKEDRRRIRGDRD